MNYKRLFLLLIVLGSTQQNSNAMGLFQSVQDTAGRAWGSVSQTATNISQGAWQRVTGTYQAARQRTTDACQGTWQRANDAYQGTWQGATNACQAVRQRTEGAYQRACAVPGQVSDSIHQTLEPQDPRQALNAARCQQTTILSVLADIKRNLDKAYVPFERGQTAQANILSKIRNIPGAHALVQQILADPRHQATFAQYDGNSEANKEIYYLEKLQIILTDMNRQQLDEFRELTNQITIGRLTYSKAYQIASPYVKTAIKYFICISIVVLLSKVLLPEFLGSFIASIYLGIIKIPLKMAWWGIKLPFNYLKLWGDNWSLQSLLHQKDVQACVEKCIQGQGLRTTSAPSLIKAAQELCQQNCTAVVH